MLTAFHFLLPQGYVLDCLVDHRFGNVVETERLPGAGQTSSPGSFLLVLLSFHEELDQLPTSLNGIRVPSQGLANLTESLIGLAFHHQEVGQFHPGGGVIRIDFHGLGEISGSHGEITFFQAHAPRFIVEIGHEGGLLAIGVPGEVYGLLVELGGLVEAILEVILEGLLTDLPGVPGHRRASVALGQRR